MHPDKFNLDLFYTKPVHTANSLRGTCCF